MAWKRSTRTKSRSISKKIFRFYISRTVSKESIKNLPAFSPLFELIHQNKSLALYSQPELPVFSLAQKSRNNSRNHSKSRLQRNPSL